MRDHFLPFAAPSITDAEIASVVETLKSGWITTGPKTEEFERRFAEEVDGEAALALSSGTAAMHVALAALGVGPGSVVYTTPMTFCSTVHVIEQVGAVPVLVDVEPDTLNMDPERLAEAVEIRSADFGSRNGKAPDACLPVHFAGHPCEMDPLLEVAARERMAVVEDAAHALPASYRGRMVGTLNHRDVVRAVAFSFYVTKNITTGEGGMLVGNQALIDEARLWSLHGMSHDAWRRYGEGATWRYDVVRAGFKYNMTDIQAALGLEQLSRLADFTRRRLEIVERYNQAFSGIEGLETPVARQWVDSAWHLYVLRLVPSSLRINRDQFILELADRGIGTSVHFIPVHLHTYYRARYDWKPEDFPVAYREFQRMLSLPLHPGLTEGDVDDVVEAVADVAAKYGR
jgi:dTDP-4-amino-4,6-dideoxygalactose transaminase